MARGFAKNNIGIMKPCRAEKVKTIAERILYYTIQSYQNQWHH